MLNLWSLLEELARAEITIKSRRSKAQRSLLDLLEKEDNELMFNASETIAAYQGKLFLLYTSFKRELGELALLEHNEQKSIVDDIGDRISELNLLLNPKDADLLLARLSIPANTRLLDDEYRLNFVRKKSLKYFGVQREILRMSKNSYKSYMKLHFPTTKKSKVKKLKNQQQLEFEIPYLFQPQWKLETSKLVELIAALAEVDAFGKETHRKDLWTYFGTQFNMPLSNAERLLSQMKYRKSEPAKFLDELCVEFREMMDK